MSSKPSVFDKIRAIDGLIKAYIVYLAGLFYSLVIFLVIFTFIQYDIRNTALFNSLGLSEIVIFVITQIIFLFFILNGWKYIRSISKFKFYFYFSFISYLLLAISIAFFTSSFSGSSPTIPLSFTSIQFSPIFLANWIFLSGVYLIMKDNSIGYLSLSSIFSIIFSASTLFIGIFLDTFSLLLYFFLSSLFALMISIFMTIRSLRKTLRKIEEIIIQEITFG